MKQILVGLFLIFSYSMNASESVGKICCTAVATVVGAATYQIFAGKKLEDTLFMGFESVPFHSSQLLNDPKNFLFHLEAKTEFKCGIGFGKIFLGYKTDKFDEAEALSKFGNAEKRRKKLSTNDIRALATGAATGIATYAFFKYSEKIGNRL